MKTVVINGVRKTVDWTNRGFFEYGYDLAGRFCRVAEHTFANPRHIRHVLEEGRFKITSSGTVYGGKEKKDDVDTSSGDTGDSNSVPVDGVHDGTEE